MIKIIKIKKIASMISYNLDSPRSSDEGGTWVSYYCPEKEPIVGQSSE